LKQFYAHSLPECPPNKWQLLEKHLRQVAELAGRFASKFGSKSTREAADKLDCVWDKPSNSRVLEMTPFLTATYDCLVRLSLSPVPKEICVGSCDSKGVSVRIPRRQRSVISLRCLKHEFNGIFEHDERQRFILLRRLFDGRSSLVNRARCNLGLLNNIT